jgi:putative addiction module component (TIGR02574 family)
MEEVILKKEALELPTRERILLAEALLDSLDSEASREIQSAWANEAESRQQAYQKGEIKAEEGAEVIRELRDRYGK